MGLYNLIAKELSLEKVTSLSKSLAGEINVDNFDLVVGIKRGGNLVSAEVAKNLSLPLERIGISREINLEQAYRDFYFIKPLLEIYQAYLVLTKEPRLHEEIVFEFKDKNLLLVDDVVDTGKTFNVAKTHFENLGAKSVKTAALFNLGNIKPDFYLGSGRYIYPWSKDSSFKKEYSFYLETANLG